MRPLRAVPERFRQRAQIAVVEIGQRLHRDLGVELSAVDGEARHKGGRQIDRSAGDHGIDVDIIVGLGGNLHDRGFRAGEVEQGSDLDPIGTNLTGRREQWDRRQPKNDTFTAPPRSTIPVNVSGSRCVIWTLDMYGTADTRFAGSNGRLPKNRNRRRRGDRGARQSRCRRRGRTPAGCSRTRPTAAASPHGLPRHWKA